MDHDAAAPHGAVPFDLPTALLDALDTVVATPLDRAEVRRARDAVIARRAAMLAPDTDAEVLGYTATLLAAHAALVAHDVPDPVLVLRAAQARAIAPIGGWTRQGLDAVPDPFALLREASAQRESRYFGSSFTFDHARDDGRSYHLHVTGCAFVAICAAEGASALAPLLCEVDLAWISAIDPARHGVRFRRPTTIADGADRCRFEFDRTP